MAYIEIQSPQGKEGERLGTRKTDIARVPGGAHYLHGRTGLEPVLRVPLNETSAIAWVPRKELLMVGTEDGQLVEVDPVMGTRPRNELGGIARKLFIGSDQRHYCAVLEGGRWCHGTMGEGPNYTGSHALTTVDKAFLLGRYLAIVGDHDAGREVVILEEGETKARIRLPEGTVVFSGTDSKLWYARATPRGLESGRLGSKTKFSDRDATGHRLCSNGAQVLGWTEHGAVAWQLADGSSVSFGLLDLYAGAIHGDGDWVALGTQGGVVALVDMRTAASRRSPYLTKAHQGCVHSVAFASRGRWFATASSRVQLWSWESTELPSEK